MSTCRLMKESKGLKEQGFCFGLVGSGAFGWLRTCLTAAWIAPPDRSLDWITHGSPGIPSEFITPAWISRFTLIGLISSLVAASACVSVSVNRYPEFYVETIDASFPLKAHALTLGTDAGHDIGRLRFSVGATTYGVTNVAIYPNYAPALVGTDQANDIAILRLNREVVDVEPSPLYRGSLETGNELTLVGFGAHPGDEQFGTKRVGTTPIDGITPHLLTWTYDDASEATTVPGDSGSPQFVQQGDGYHLASVASGGTHQASALGDFAYNTRIDAYIDWIAAVVGEGS